MSSPTPVTLPRVSDWCAGTRQTGQWETELPPLSTLVETLTIGGLAGTEVSIDERGTPATKTPEAAVKNIGQFYDMADPPAVERFLGDHPVVAKVLLEAWAQLVADFGPAPQACLELVTDPEDDGGPELFAYIRTTLDVEDALARLHKFDQEFFLDRLHRVAGDLNFDLEFI